MVSEKPKKYRVKVIPIGLVQKGIEYCKVNALGYLEEARLILAKKRAEHAYVSVELAIEELGKAVLLKEKRDEAWKTGKWEISIKVKEEWENHKYKAKKAWNLLDSSLKILHKGAFKKGVFSKYAFDQDTEASHNTRLECAYVEFDEDSQIWWLGSVIDHLNLESLIKNVEEVISTI